MRITGRQSRHSDHLLSLLICGSRYITSDCDADDDVIGAHHYLNHTEQQGVADILHAGTDVDCGGNIGHYAQSALDAGTITEADIDERLSMLFRVRFRLGHFDPVGPLQEIGADQICNGAYSNRVTFCPICVSNYLLHEPSGNQSTVRM